MTNFHLDTGRKLNVYKTCRRQPGGLVNVLCTFNLHPVSRGMPKKYLNYLRSTFPTLEATNLLTCRVNHVSGVNIMVTLLVRDHYEILLLIISKLKRIN